MIIVKVPRRHAGEWFARYAGGDARAPRATPRTITLELSHAALADLVVDARYHAETFHGEWVGGVDLGAAAARVLKSLRKQGVLS